MTRRQSWLRALRAAFPHTIPVLTGYLVLGIAYGILMETKGMADLYMHGTIESSTQNVKQTFDDALSDLMFQFLDGTLTPEAYANRFAEAVR
jgi:hypothetical protein